MPDTWFDEHVDFDVTVRDAFVDDLERTLRAEWQRPGSSSIDVPVERTAGPLRRRRGYRPLGWAAAAAAVAAGSLALITGRDDGTAPADTITSVPGVVVDPMLAQIDAARAGLAGFLAVHYPFTRGSINLEGCPAITAEQANAALDRSGIERSFWLLGTEVEWHEPTSPTELAIVCFGDDGEGFGVTVVVADVGETSSADAFTQLAELASLDPIGNPSIIDGDRVARGCTEYADGPMCGHLWEYNGLSIWLQVRSPEPMPDETERLFGELLDDVLNGLATVDPAAFETHSDPAQTEHIQAARAGLARSADGVTVEAPVSVDGSCPAISSEQIIEAVAGLRFAGFDLGGWHAEIEIDEFGPGVPSIQCFADADGDAQDATDVLRTDVIVADFGSPIVAQRWLDELAVEDADRLPLTGIAPDDELIGTCEQGEAYLECTALWKWDGLVVGLTIRGPAENVDQLSTVALLQAVLPDVFANLAAL